MSNIFLFNNINIKSSQFVTDKIFVVIEDDLIFDNFEKDFCFYFSKGFQDNITVLKDFKIENVFNKAANLSVFGWKKEAVPILHRKTSLITRIFKRIFE